VKIWPNYIKNVPFLQGLVMVWLWFGYGCQRRLNLLQ